MPALSLRRSLLFALALVAFVATLWTPRVAAWDDQDHEIFDLVDYLKKVQKGQDRSFYDILGVDSKATLNTLNQAFRRKSLEFHPDKNPSEEAQALFTRLGPIMKILRNPAIRERYDFFMKNGVPVWRGTGYFYRRYRPGFFSVLFGLVFFSAGIQYLVQWLNYTLTVRKIEHYRAELLKNGQGPTSRSDSLINSVAAQATQSASGKNPSAATMESVDRSGLTRRQIKQLERDEKLRAQETRLAERAQKAAQDEAKEEAERLPEDPEEARYVLLQRHWGSMDPESVAKPSWESLWIVTLPQYLMAEGPHMLSRGVAKSPKPANRIAKTNEPVASRTRQAANPERKSLHQRRQ